MPRVAAAALALAALAALAVRLTFSVDLSDEAYYAALPFRFWLGSRPFIDECFVLQTSGLMLVPPVALYLRAVGDTSGLILFLRCLYGLLQLGLAAAWFPLLKRRSRAPLAMAALSAGLLLVPYNIPALSYNTLGAGCLSLGTALLCYRRFLAAGVALGLATLAYPPLVLVACLGVALTWRQAGARVLAGGAAVAVAFLALYPQSVLNSGDVLFYSRLIPGYGGGALKLAGLGFHAARTLARCPTFWLTVLLWKLRRPRVAALALALAWVVPGELYTGSLICAVLLLGLALTAPERPPELPLMLGMGLAAALVTAYSSTDGFLNAGVGAGALAVPCLALAWPRLPGAAWAVLCLGLTALLWGQSYRDLPPLSLSSRVPSGPFAGLHTSSERVAYLVQLQGDVRQVVRPGDRIAAFNDLPAVYLMSSAMPAPPTLWSQPVDNFNPRARDFVLGKTLRPRVVVKNTAPPRVQTGDNPMAAAFATGYRVTVARGLYLVLEADSSR